MPHTIHTILDEFRREAQTKRGLGDRFERLMCRYFELDPQYEGLFSGVWLWSEWPQRPPHGDNGIDIVAQEAATGDLWAIQCKFYSPDHVLSKADVDSFLGESSDPRYKQCLIVSTTDKWGPNAMRVLEDQRGRVKRLRLRDLEQSPIDWSKFSLKDPQALKRRAPKVPRPHQEAAVSDVLAGLAAADRGKLIMACGTGKTFTSLCVAKRLAPTGHVLFLVPSLSLMSQALREWTAESDPAIHALAVCSDTKVGKRSKKDEDDGDLGLFDLPFPATTSAKQIVRQYNQVRARAQSAGAPPSMTVVFSTYQSIDAVAEAQKAGLPAFDLIICDEAHRTTGVTLSGEDESQFVKVHNPDFLRAKKRLYMTATPRIYSDDTKSRAKEAKAELCSMDDPAIYGAELHRLGFGEAVKKSLLSDYKVLVLAVDEQYVSATFQRQLADANNELNLEDAVKITGCWNGLAKRLDKATASAVDLAGDVPHMRRAVAFSRSIKDSQAFKRMFEDIQREYQKAHPDESPLRCEIEHVDGTFDALRRSERLDWLKAEPGENACRILTNARCLSEGVDVPALDAVLFLNPRNSVVDVVQSVGRVMRRAEHKKYGYIILPVGIPANVAPEEALSDNEKYKVVWQVLQALRAHDDRFNAMINQIELNRNPPGTVDVIGVGGPEPSDRGAGEPGTKGAERQARFSFLDLDAWKTAIYARIVIKCGDRRYWENWAKDVAEIAERHTARIRALLDAGQPRHRAAFAAFLGGLRENINPSIGEDDAIEMLSQHLITRPVFDALFEGYAFTKHNPVSIAMQAMLDTLEDQALEKETARLSKFYESVRERAAGIDNAEGRQKVVIELYDKFFRTAFPKMAERLGIVYTPVEVVDFIIHSVNDVLRSEFQTELGDKGVHIIDPFTGTGTFIVRLLQSGLIPEHMLEWKYKNELHANEIVLLAYYIAAINIEETFHSKWGGSVVYGEKAAAGPSYVPFEGIVLTDTFQLAEKKGELEERMFPENNRRVKRQKQSPIRVVIGNPPYSVGQGNANDNNQNLKYPALDARIGNTYATRSTAANKNSVYDSYIRAIRWASDRIADKGVIGFVTNNSFIDSNAMDGVRGCLAEDFSAIYVFNLRGNQRTSGEISRMEGGKIFGSGSRAGIAISLLVKNPVNPGSRTIRYYDIGDYLSREEKLDAIRTFKSVGALHRENKWRQILPNAAADWINQRDPVFEQFISLGEKKDDAVPTVFDDYSAGLQTNRDAWVYNFSGRVVEANMRRMIKTYNEQVSRLEKAAVGKQKQEIQVLADSLVEADPAKIKWSSSLMQDLVRFDRADFSDGTMVLSVYRPFCKQIVYYSEQFNHRTYQIPKIFPARDLANQVIVVSGVGAAREFSALISDAIPNLHMNDTSQCFPLYLYESDEAAQPARQGDLLGGGKNHAGDLVDGYRRRYALTDGILADFRAAYDDKKITKEDIFYYVYGILHSPEYRSRFASDLKKMLPRIPFTREAADFRRFSKAGRDLAELHLHYETIDPWPLKEHTDVLQLDPAKDYLVQKMTFARKGKDIDKSAIVYNAHLTLAGIPLDAYEYVVNGKPAIEWVMERYQVTRDKDSGIVNDPNDWAREHEKPRYIVDLLKRIVRVSVETMKIVNGLPALNERKER